MEGLGYWFFLAGMYLLSAFLKKRKQQAARQQGEQEKLGSQTQESQNPFKSDFLKDILPKSKFKNKITVLDFKKEFYNTYFEGDVTKNFEDVFLVEDKSSHLKINARIPYVKKSFEKLFE